MPDIQANITYWDGLYDWSAGGEEWSTVWGGSAAQWFGSLLPRLRRYLPANSVLEIAQGYGRWTQYLLPACKRYVAFDLSQECVDACRKIFASAAHAEFHKTDGLTLPGIPDHSIDFVFSFDSLVHAELDVICAYVSEILRVLAPGGAAFIHHSNLAAHPELADPKVNPTPHGRGRTVSAEAVAAAIVEAGGSVRVQETVTWDVFPLLDCLTLFVPGQSEAPPLQLQNDRFMDEANLIRSFQAPWAKPLAKVA